MLEFLGTPEVVIFTVALVLMALVGIVEAIGLGVSAFDIDIDPGDGGLLGWLGFGHVPFLAVLVAFLATFGIVGVAGQQLALTIRGELLPLVIAVPAALAASLPPTAFVSRGIGRIMPRDETTAFPLDGLVGRSATIVVGTASRGSAARARVVDPHGQAHHVLVEPDDGDVNFFEGQTVLLVRRETHAFRAITHEPYRLSSWIDQ